MIKIIIVCGCNSEEKPAVFHTLEGAVNHTKDTGHELHGTIIVNNKESV